MTTSMGLRPALSSWDTGIFLSLSFFPDIICLLSEQRSYVLMPSCSAFPCLVKNSAYLLHEFRIGVEALRFFQVPHCSTGVPHFQVDHRHESMEVARFGVDTQPFLH